MKRIGRMVVCLAGIGLAGPALAGGLGQGEGGSGPPEQSLTPSEPSSEQSAQSEQSVSEDKMSSPEASMPYEDQSPELGTGGSEPPSTTEMQSAPPESMREESTTVVMLPPAEKEKKGASKGPYVLLGGGADFYTGDYAPTLDPGGSYGAILGWKPLRSVGVEVAYNGAVNDVDHDFAGSTDGAVNGPDFVRNAGQAQAIIGLAPTRLHPFLLGGIGIENYQVRGAGDVGTNPLGFSDDTHAYVPAGVGVRADIGAFTADLRGAYNFLLDQDFAPIDDDAGDGRITGLLNIGANF
jgi:hypothetical protein